MSGHINVTTQAGHKRHLALPGSAHTLCHIEVVAPAARYSHKSLTQARINRLHLCGQCAKSARIPAFVPHKEIITFPWQTWIAARRKARMQGQGFEDYILGLIDADIATPARSPMAQFADEVAELRTQWGAR